MLIIIPQSPLIRSFEAYRSLLSEWCDVQSLGTLGLLGLLGLFGLFGRCSRSRESVEIVPPALPTDETDYMKAAKRIKRLAQEPYYQGPFPATLDRGHEWAYALWELLDEEERSAELIMFNAANSILSLERRRPHRWNFSNFVKGTGQWKRRQEANAVASLWNNVMAN